MYYTEKTNQLINDYDHAQQSALKNVEEDNKGLPEELRDKILDQIINQNKEIFKSNAHHLLSELNSELVGVEYQLTHIRWAIEKTKIILKMIPGDKELFLVIPDFGFPNVSDIQLLSSLMKKYSTGVYHNPSKQKE